jgi:ABC-type sugar transport system ATPase subunit
MDVVVKIQKISKTFPGVKALDNVDLVVNRGEILGLVGRNGAGKSTLMHILCGVLRPDTGKIIVDSKEYSYMTPREAICNGIVLVPQSSRLILELSVAENIMLSSYPCNSLGLIKWKDIYREAEERLKRIGLNIDVKTPVKMLKPVEQKMIEIAKAIFTPNMKLLILDEPTAALPLDDIQVLFNFVRGLKAHNISIIYISHHLEEVFEICDRVAVMVNGKIIGTYPISELDMPSLVKLVSGGDMSVYSRKREELKSRAEPILKLEDCTLENIFHNVSLEIYPKEIIGFTGLRGSGASELAQTLYGIKKLDSGRILFEGSDLDLDLLNPSRAIGLGIVYLPEDRRRLGLINIRSVKENITLPVLKQLLNKFKLLDLKKESSLASEYVDRLGIVTPSLDQAVEHLSGGNQQKVLFARAMVTQPKLLILEEPTQGIDIRTKNEIYKILGELSIRGITIIVVSTEVQELLDNCDRIYVFFNGQITAEVSPIKEKVSKEDLILKIEGR